MDLPVVVGDHYELVRWLVGRTQGYPKGLRFSLGERTLDLALEVLEQLLEATYSRSKDEPLRRANLGLEKLRFLVRLAKDERCMSLKQYEFASSKITDIGKQIGGWRRVALPALLAVLGQRQEREGTASGAGSATELRQRWATCAWCLTSARRCCSR